MEYSFFGTILGPLNVVVCFAIMLTNLIYFLLYLFAMISDLIYKLFPGLSKSYWTDPLDKDNS